MNRELSLNERALIPICLDRKGTIINELEESSTFGRTISEYIMSRLAQRGYKVIEMKFRKSVFMQKKGGEFMLSRELKEVSTEHNVQAVVMGTYSLARDLVYISSSVINPSDSTIRATYDYAIPLGANTARLLQNDQKTK
jgi:TolB-like protein